MIKNTSHRTMSFLQNNQLNILKIFQIKDEEIVRLYSNSKLYRILILFSKMKVLLISNNERTENEVLSLVIGVGIHTLRELYHFPKAIENAIFLNEHNFEYKCLDNQRILQQITII